MYLIRNNYPLLLNKGKPISQGDACIGAICYVNNAILATRNVKDFEYCSIDIFNPWE